MALTFTQLPEVCLIWHPISKTPTNLLQVNNLGSFTSSTSADSHESCCDFSAEKPAISAQFGDKKCRNLCSFIPHRPWSVWTSS